MIVLALLLPLLACPLPAAQEGSSETASGATGGKEPPWPGELVIERGEGFPRLLAPRKESLRFRVEVALVGVAVSVGTVTLKSEVEPYRESLLVTGTNGATPKETACFTIHAKGDYQLYSMDATIESRVLPQEWPRIAYRYTHQGTENRRREILVGLQGNVQTASYRKDTNDDAPPGTRIWRDATTREVPEGVMDLLSAVYLVRTLIRDDAEDLRFPLIDKLRLWNMRILRGEECRMKTPAGEFDVVQIQLDPEPWEGEELSEEKVKRFEGLFGMQGSIHLWVEKNSGVPVRIQGDLPVKFLKLGVDIELESFEGVPPEFSPAD